MSNVPPYNPYPQQPPPQPGAGDSRSTAVLVTGILSLACCGLFGIYAFVVGNQMKKEYGSIPSPANIGYILGIVGFAIQALVGLMYAAIVVIAILGSSTT